MLIHEGYENLHLISPVATLGIFDGVHRGHRKLLDLLVSHAKASGSESVVITFTPHPRLVLEQNNAGLFFLTTLEEKTKLLSQAGIDNLIIIRFDREFSNIRACDFVTDILIGKIGVKHLIVGHDHRFGRKGEGDFNTIKKCSENLDFRVEQVPAFVTGEGVISSSLIRDELLQGNITMANNLLGYTYTLSGTVIEGKRIGRIIGYPTANIKPDYEHKLIPANGVYAVRVQLEDRIYPGMMSIGSNPTVNDDINFRSIEVNIIGFDGDLYGRVISVSFVKKLRNEKKFESLTQLKEQMNLDSQETMQLLG